ARIVQGPADRLSHGRVAAHAQREGPAPSSHTRRRARPLVGRRAPLAPEALHERGLLLADLARQAVAELLEEGPLRGRGLEPALAVDGEQLLERRARDVDAGEVEVRDVRHTADRGVGRAHLAVDSRDHPAEHAQVLAEPGPEVAAIAALTEPV